MYHVTSADYCLHLECEPVNTSPFVSPTACQPSIDFADKWTQIFYCIKHTRTVPLSIPLEFSKRTHVYLLLFLCGDISLNPGPVKNPCGICSKPVARNHRAILCEACYNWHHIKCAGISPDDYICLGSTDDPWCCHQCSHFQFSDSFFLDIDCVPLDHSLSSNDISTHDTDSSQSPMSPFEELRDLRKLHPRKFLVTHLNINSLKSKFDEIYELLNESQLVDLLFISETKIDSSFRDSIFEAQGYKLERRDRDVHGGGGGVAAFIRSDIPARRLKDLESKYLENITYEVTLNKQKWSILCVYRPPSMKDSEFRNEMTNT